MRVAVLMSTYQGEAFVEEQIRSILSQLPHDGALIVRDDGSSDGTLEVIGRIRDARIQVSAGPNLGFAGSFLQLLSEVGPQFDVIMLSDQDDVWLPGKIERATAALEGSGDTPTMYCSRLRLVDAALQPLGDTRRWPRGPSFANALCENIATGCTIALNPAAVRRVTHTGERRRIYFHDWWIYLVVSAFGRVIVDDATTVLYRQHGRNVVGRRSGLQAYLPLLAFIRKRSWIHVMYQQIDCLREAHGASLDAQQRQLVERYFNPRSVASVLRLLFIPVARRQFLQDELLLRAMLLAELACGRGLLPRPASA